MDICRTMSRWRTHSVGLSSNLLWLRSTFHPEDLNLTTKEFQSSSFLPETRSDPEVRWCLGVSVFYLCSDKPWSSLHHWYSPK